MYIQQHEPVYAEVEDVARMVPNDAYGLVCGCSLQSQHEFTNEEEAEQIVL